MKEPWQMTHAEWFRAFDSIGAYFIGSDTGRASSGKGSPSATLSRMDARSRLKMGLRPHWDAVRGDYAPARHREVIEHAVSIGLPVPLDVLDEYPDMCRPPAPRPAGSGEGEAG